MTHSRPYGVRGCPLTRTDTMSGASRSVVWRLSGSQIATWSGHPDDAPVPGGWRWSDLPADLRAACQDPEGWILVRGSRGWESRGRPIVPCAACAAGRGKHKKTCPHRGRHGDASRIRVPAAGIRVSGVLSPDDVESIPDNIREKLHIK